MKRYLAGVEGKRKGRSEGLGGGSGDERLVDLFKEIKQMTCTNETYQVHF